MQQPPGFDPSRVKNGHCPLPSAPAFRHFRPSSRFSGVLVVNTLSLAIHGRFKSTALAGLAFATAVSLSSGALAQCTVANVNLGPGALSPSLSAALAASATSSAASAAALAGSLGNLGTVFQTQQGSAFVSAPNDPKPGQPGGGLWVRGVGGEVTNKFSSSSVSQSSVNFNGGAQFGSAAQTQNCNGSVHQNFAGMQVGQDISRLNLGGWNLHLGTTAGFLNSHATANSGGTTDFDVPFLGTYLVATHGRFFADVMVREEFYNISLSDAGVGAFGQRFGGRGLSVSSSAGYNFALANNWFIEPSGGFIWSRTNLDNFNLSNAGVIPGFSLVTTVATAPIDSQIGRLSLRGGTTIASGNIIWQPFASASVFSEFGGNVTSSTNSIVPTILDSSNSTTTRVGTYGQYSLGVAAQVVNTGWLGFARVDYRNGNNIEGWTGNAGLRYQFTPEAIAAIMPVKAPVKAAGGVIAPTNWTGFYAGGFFGMAYGKTNVAFLGDPYGTTTNPRVMGLLGGGEIGYNYQTVNNWVFGVEADLGAANVRGAKTCGLGNGLTATAAASTDTINNGYNPAALNCENGADWMATVAARIGYSLDRTLYYVKAGGAWTEDHVTASCIFGSSNNPALLGPLSGCLNQQGNTTNGFTTSGNRSGWLVGFGTEFDLGNNWSAKAEYDLLDLGSRTALASDRLTTVKDSGTISQVKVGVNYRFSGAAPIVTKY
jgi:opacity protein-like surface antigen